MKGKIISLFIVAMVLVIVAYYFKEPVITEHVIEDETNSLKELEGEYRDLFIKHVNTEGENENLKKEIDRLHEEIFELGKIILNSEIELESLGYSESAEMIYKEIKEKQFLLLYKDEWGDHLIVGFPREVLDIPLTSLRENESFNWNGSNGFYAGFIEDSEIMKVQVKENAEVYNSDIITLNSQTQLWYCVYEHDRKFSGEPDKMKIEALNKDGEIVWEVSFDGIVGG